MDGKWGYIDKKNKKEVPCTYEKAYSFSEGLAAVCMDGKWGYIDSKNKVQIPFIYEKVFSFYKGFATVRMNKKWGVINKKGEWVISPIWGLIENFENEGVVVVAHIIEGEEDDEEMEVLFLSGQSIQYGNYGLFNKEGVLLLDTIYEHIGFFQNGYASITKDGKSGFINTKGEIVVPIQFDRVTFFSEGMAAVANYEERSSYHDFGYSSAQVDSLETLVDQSKKRIWPEEKPQVDRLLEEAYAKAQLQKNSRELVWGYVNEVGALVIPLQFDLAESFKNGVAEVKKGYQCLYQGVSDNDLVKLFENGVTEVKKRPQYLEKAFPDKAKRIAYQEQINIGSNLVDKNGQLQWKKYKAKLQRYNDNIIGVVEVKGAGAYTTKMSEVIAPQYESLHYLGANYYAVVVKETQRLKIVGNGLDLMLGKSIIEVKGVHQNIFLVEALTKDKKGRSSKKIGLINTKGKWVVKPIYKRAYKRY